MIIKTLKDIRNRAGLYLWDWCAVLFSQGTSIEALALARTLECESLRALTRVMDDDTYLFPVTPARMKHNIAVSRAFQVKFQEEFQNNIKRLRAEECLNSQQSSPSSSSRLYN